MSDQQCKLDKPASGFSGTHGQAWDNLALNEPRRVPAFLLEDRSKYLGSEPLSPERYPSAQFFQLELEKMWPNVWQFAARVEELPEVGDTVLYEKDRKSVV